MPISQVGAYNINNIEIGIPQRVVAAPQPHEMVVPDGFEIRRRIWEEFTIQVLDSDIRFSGSECAAIEEALQEIKKKKKEHLIGVRQIVKNREQRVRLQNGLHIHAGGAYDPENRRIYLFDTTDPQKIPEVVTHEVGHAVSYFNLEFEKFMDFVHKSGYQMFEMRKYFVPGNLLYNIGLKKVYIPFENWDKVIARFSLQTLAKKQDLFGEILIDNERKKQKPWDENPLEQFAWTYEWYVKRNEEFLKMAVERAERGDDRWLNDYAFLREEVFMC